MIFLYVRPYYKLNLIFLVFAIVSISYDNTVLTNLVAKIRKCGDIHSEEVCPGKKQRQSDNYTGYKPNSRRRQHDQKIKIITQSVCLASFIPLC